MKKKSTAIKVFLSLFLVYHLGAILILPNPSSILSRQWGGFFTPYANLVGFNTPWRFFAPEPSSHVYFEYQVIREGGDSEIHRWPPANRDDYFQNNYMRLVYHSRLTTGWPERKEQFFVPYVCRIHPGARAISIETLSEELPSIELSQIEGQDIKGLVEMKSWGVERFDCPIEESP